MTRAYRLNPGCSRLMSPGKLPIPLDLQIAKLEHQRALISSPILPVLYEEGPCYELSELSELLAMEPHLLH